MIVILFLCCLAGSFQLFGMESASTNQPKRTIDIEKNAKQFKAVLDLCKEKRATIEKHKQYEKVLREIISNYKK
ncbi:hypothetical protein HYX58_06345 [Candidatus Dependentiae bacterium]|nr:hypothetical protein [Candidatus Dependentiae bacterium]